MNLQAARNLGYQDWQARAQLVRPETRLFVDGRYLPAGNGGVFLTTNPANNAAIAEVSLASAADVDVAVDNARRAFRSGCWSRMAPRQRMDIMYRWCTLIESHAAELALLETLDMGKPISDVINLDLPAVIDTVRFMAECIDKIEGAVTSTPADVVHFVMREPFGVVAAISPWNYPLLMAAWKVAPALAAGNTVVLKPAEQSPLSALLFAELFLEAGGPAGVFNVINGPGEVTGRALALHNDVAKISFTGSTEVGKLMLQYAGQSNMKRVSLECGGKSPQIFMADLTDLDRAATVAVNGIFSNMGEVCSAGSRLLVDRRIHDQFVERFTSIGKQAFAPGDPLDPATNMGPLVTRDAQRRVLALIESGRTEGARLAFGGDVPERFAGGSYVNPTLFTGVRPQMRIAREEIFGPVASVIAFDSVEQAIEIANDSLYGLAAGIWTRDLNTAHRFIRAIEAGVISVNCFDEGDMTQPFGGYKQSGNARDKCFESLLSYTQLKSAWIRLDS